MLLLIRIFNIALMVIITIWTIKTIKDSKHSFDKPFNSVWSVENYDETKKLIKDTQIYFKSNTQSEMARVTTSCNPHPIDISPESGRNGVSIVPGSPEDTARKTAAALCQSQVDTKYDVPTQDIYSAKKKEGFSNDRQNYSIYIIL